MQQYVYVILLPVARWKRMDFSLNWIGPICSSHCSLKRQILKSHVCINVPPIHYTTLPAFSFDVVWRMQQNLKISLMLLMSIAFSTVLGGELWFCHRYKNVHTCFQSHWTRLFFPRCVQRGKLKSDCLVWVIESGESLKILNVIPPIEHLYIKFELIQ